MLKRRKEENTKCKSLFTNQYAALNNSNDSISNKQNKDQKDYKIKRKASFIELERKD